MKIRHLILLALTALLLAGCGPKKTELEQRIDQAEKTWKAQRMNSYVLESTCISLWDMQTYRVVVTDGRVVDHAAECSPSLLTTGDCKLQEYDPQDFTVDGLFRKARALAKTEKPQFAEVEFNPTYAFPSILGYNDPNVYDEEWSCTALIP